MYELGWERFLLTDIDLLESTFDLHVLYTQYTTHEMIIIYKLKEI